MIVTIGCPRPALTMQLLAQALGTTSAVVGELVVVDEQATTRADFRSRGTTIHCIPSPFSRVLSIQHGYISTASSSSRLARSSKRGFRENVQAFGTYIRHQGRVPLEYCYKNIPVSIDIGEATSQTGTTDGIGERPSVSPMPDADGQLKEIAIPDPGGVLLDTLEQHKFTQRVVTGVYSISTGSASADHPTCYIRPLPIAVQDHRIPIPTFVFHNSSQHLQHTPDTTAWSRIGDRGGSSLAYGQWMHTALQTNHLLDVRLCSRSLQRLPTSMFNEAQVSLLAGSLESLQSNRVLDATTTQGDAKSNRADCWIEVREQAIQTIRKQDTTSSTVL